jgi:hypothetical protein
MKLSSVIMISLVSGCATVAERHPNEMRAACAAQEFLRVHGYLHELANGPVALELMDGIGYGNEDDGSIDWARLAADRRDRFNNRLAGVTRHAEGYSAFYDLGGGVRPYVAISPDLSRLRVTHAPRQNQPEVSITERTLSCDPVR